MSPEAEKPDAMVKGGLVCDWEKKRGAMAQCDGIAMDGWMDGCTKEGRKEVEDKEGGRNAVRYL